jgi:hypothetical protein
MNHRKKKKLELKLRSDFGFEFKLKSIAPSYQTTFVVKSNSMHESQKKGGAPKLKLGSFAPPPPPS